MKKATFHEFFLSFLTANGFRPEEILPIGRWTIFHFNQKSFAGRIYPLYYKAMYCNWGGGSQCSPQYSSRSAKRQWRELVCLFYLLRFLLSSYSKKQNPNWVIGIHRPWASFSQPLVAVPVSRPVVATCNDIEIFRAVFHFGEGGKILNAIPYIYFLILTRKIWGGHPRAPLALHCGPAWIL